MVKGNFIYSVESLEEAYRKTMINGVPKGINTGLNSLDELFRLDKGKLVVVTGIPNMGKSEFVDYLCVQYNKLYGMRTVYFSPENQPIAYHIGKLFRKFEGRKDTKEDIVNEHSRVIRNYIYENFSFFNYAREYKLGEILDTAREVAYERGAEILVIDSYNKVSRDISVNETEVIGRELDMLERFAKELNMIVILVAHPRKMEKKADGKYVVPSAYDINGSANFYNKADFCISVHRNFSPNYAIIKVDKVKFNNYGGQGEIELGYNNVSGNYFDIPDEVGFNEGSDAIYTPPTETPFDINTHVKSGKEWLNVSCACSKRVTHKETTETNLFEFLTCERPDLLDSLKRVRETTDSKVRSSLKASLLPIVCPSVVFEGERKTENIKGYTNLLCIDIDGKDNPKTIGTALDVLKSLPYVAFAQKSASGDGYFAIIPVRDGRNLEDHFNAVGAELAEKGIIIDKACKDYVRARFFSHDPEHYINPRCSVFVKRKKIRRGADEYVSTSTTPKSFDKKDISVTQAPQYSTPQRTLSTEEALARACIGTEYLNICPTYQTWFEVGCALANELGENGRKYFHTLSNGYKGYSRDETDRKFDELLNDADRYNYGSGTVFHYIKEAKTKAGRV